jgi:predicted secreted Zn-dependent protease
MSPEPIGRRPGAAARRVFVAFIALGAVLSGLESARAEPPTVTKINYYTVEATTAQSLNEQMITRGPMHGPGRAYANIVAKPDYSGQLVQGSTCRVEDFLIEAEFIMTLPRLGAGTKLSRDVATRWESFQSFVRRHEEGHRTIWIETMDKAQTRITALRAPSCQELQVRIDGAFQEEWSAGERRQDAYDRADQQKLASHPLLVAAKSARRKVGAALAPPPPQPPSASIIHRVGGRAM